jgi:DNA-binding transcriptional MerR regulator
MIQGFLSTTEVARAAGVHPNTVRLYEAWGFLPPVPRSPSGYRRYTQQHVDQMRLARAALHGGWPGPVIRESALALVRRGAAGDLDGTLALAHDHLALVRAERARAEIAAGLVQRWAGGLAVEPIAAPLARAEAARLLDLTPEIARSWEREGLLHVPRDPANGYRRYGPAEISRLRVIRMLRLAGYSTMAILRMLLQLDSGRPADLRAALDTPRPDEDVYVAADRWLTTLAEQEQRAADLIVLIEEIAHRQLPP